MLDPYKGTGRFHVLCTFLRPIRTGAKITYSDEESITCYCDDSGFKTYVTRVDNRRSRSTSGVLTTRDILATEVDIDWKIIYDGDEYIITGITRSDNNTQKAIRTNPTILTSFEVRR